MPAPTSSLGVLQTVRSLQTEPSFHRFLLRAVEESCVVDLVAEPPVVVPLGAAEIRVESPLGLLAQKLCALLGRAEPRDLDDTGRLLDAGVALDDAAAAAASIDGGFSPLTLAWVLERWDLGAIAAAAGYDAASSARLDEVRRRLIDRLTAEV